MVDLVLADSVAARSSVFSPQGRQVASQILVPFPPGREHTSSISGAYE